MGENQREVRYSKGGKVTLTVHSRVSADGKTLTTTVKGTDMQGKPVEGTAVYDKRWRTQRPSDRQTYRENLRQRQVPSSRLGESLAVAKESANSPTS